MVTERFEPVTIGVFDSGIGGLSVLKAINQQLPALNIIYLADQAHVPYGSRPLAEVQRFAREITRLLIAEGANMIVVACNAASAAALHYLRDVFSEIRFVGMEPAVKPAAEKTHSGVVGVLATPATFQGALYASVVERFAGGVTILQDTCPGLVNEIEKGKADSPVVYSILESTLQPMLQRGADTIVLGCTHYPFVIPVIQEITGPDVRVINPAPAIARQVEHLLFEEGIDIPALKHQKGWRRYITTGDSADLEIMLSAYSFDEGTVTKAVWCDGGLAVKKTV